MNVFAHKNTMSLHPQVLEKARAYADLLPHGRSLETNLRNQFHEISRIHQDGLDAAYMVISKPWPEQVWRMKCQYLRWAP